MEYIENSQDFTQKPKKRDLLFLHGYLSNGQSFNLQKNYFSPYFNVYAPDLKGFGENLGMEYPYSLDDYCREVREYIQDNGLNSPSVIAHSFGGRITLKLASTNPNLFSKLILVGCAGLKPKLTLKKAVKKCAFSLLKNFLSKEKLKGFYSKDYLMLSPVMQQSFKKIVNEHLDYTLKDIKNQTLICFGEKDSETPLYMAKRLNRGIKNSGLLILKNAGHFCFIDNPLKFNMEVKEFLLS